MVKHLPLMSIIHLFLARVKRQHGPIVLSRVSEDFNGSTITSASLQVHNLRLVALPFPAQTDEKKKKKKVQGIQSCQTAFLELGHDSFRATRQHWHSHTCHRRHSEHIQFDPRAPRTHHLLCARRGVCLICWLVPTEAKLIQLQCLALWSSWEHVSC